MGGALILRFNIGTTPLERRMAPTHLAQFHPVSCTAGKIVFASRGRPNARLHSARVKKGTTEARLFGLLGAEEGCSAGLIVLLWDTAMMLIDHRCNM